MEKAPLPPTAISRRSLLFGGLVGITLLVSGCASQKALSQSIYTHEVPLESWIESINEYRNSQQPPLQEPDTFILGRSSCAH
jgi:hypothetical protein